MPDSANRSNLTEKMIEIEPRENGRNEFQDNDLVCHCFKYTKKDVETDFKENGRSLIYRRVAAEKKSGKCNCATLNPRGR